LRKGGIGVKERGIFNEIVSILEELKELYNQADDRRCQLFIELKIKEIYYKALTNEKHELAKVIYKIYQDLVQEPINEEKIILN